MRARTWRKRATQPAQPGLGPGPVGRPALPDGRTKDQQAQFLKAEVKPQALECILSAACGHRFQISIDNLNGEESEINTFKQALNEQVRKYCEQGLPQRAETFRKALCHFFGVELVKRHLTILP